MARKNAAQIRENWQRKMNNAGQSMRDGVSNVTENPMEKAAMAEDRWAAGVQRARENGKFRDGVGSVSLSTWKDRYIKKGLPRIAEGVAAAGSVVEAFHAQHQPICEQAHEEARAMKAAGADGRARMLANFERMSNFRFQRPRT